MTRASAMIAPPPRIPDVPGIEVANRFLGEPPIDLVGMANALGISVNMNARLGPNISGKIIKTRDAEGDRFNIEVNGSHSPNRRRFTLAHEISHFLLHKHLMTSGLVDNEIYRSGLGDRVEFEANRLAAELLMPASLVRAVWHSGNRSIGQLANAFGASEDAMRIRLEQLGFGA